MKKRSRYILYMIVTTLLISCTDEEKIIHQVVPDNNDVTIQIEFPTAGKGLESKAINENGIDSLEILVFTPPSSGSPASTSDVFAYRITKRGGDIQTLASNKKKVTASLERNKEQRIILLANVSQEATSWLNANLAEDVTTLAQILPNLTYSGSLWGVNHLTSGETSFPMWGQENAHTTISSAGTPAEKTIKMIRSVAKISVKGDDSDPALGFGTTYTLDSIYICDAVPNGFITPFSDELHLEKVTKPNQNTTGARLDLGYVPTDSIYIPECDTLIGGNKPVFVVIKSHFDDGSGPQPYYYKIAFRNNTQSVPLLRNHSYTIMISQILAKGYNSFAEAKDAPASNDSHLIVTIGDDNNTEIIDYTKYNDQYMVGALARGIKLDWMAHGHSIPVYTTYTGGWTATVVEGGSWLSLGSNDSGAAFQVNYLDLEVTQNSGLDSRKAVVHITAGALTLPVEISQVIGSNSYGIPLYDIGPTTVQIPINSANLGGSRVSSSTTGLKVKILWQEGSGVTFSVPSSTYNGGDVFTVTQSGTGADGNAVVVLVKEGSGIGMVGGVPSDEILWSWHVWAGYNPNLSARIFNGYFFMRNTLGGDLYYQWGRKDPFLNRLSGTIKTYTVSEVAVADNLQTSIMNPNVFYTSSSAPYDWIGTSPTAQRNNLWETNNNEKGPYDPCPFGWRVPPADAYTGFSDGMSTLYIFFAGHLSRINGNVENASTGYVWTTSMQSTQAQGYSFSAMNAPAVLVNESRAQAYQIRCVKDIIRR